MTPAERIIVALDVASATEALGWAKRLRGRVGLFKIGLQLYTAEGPALVDRIVAEHGPVFLDLKLHDIPNTVAGAVRAACRLGVSMLTLHAAGGTTMLRAACEAAGEAAGGSGLLQTPADSSSASGTTALPGVIRPRLLAVTVLTSLGQDDLAGAGIVRTVEEQVVNLAETAWLAGCDGLVASAREVRSLRRVLGVGPTIVTPGVRGPGEAAGDQQRVATPRDAVDAGADYLVVGRPILSAPDPEAALETILASLG